MKIGIFTSFQGYHNIQKVIDACCELKIEYEVIDILSADWLNNIQRSNCDGFFCLSNCISQEKKTIQDERYYFVSKILQKSIYPDFLGLYIHENKRNMASWLEYFGFPIAKTTVFTNKTEAINHLNKCNYPIVVKANVGAGASKVRIVKSKNKAKRMASKCFPLFNDERFITLSKGLIYSNKIKGIPIPDIHNIQKDYFLIQEFIKDIKYEWRIIKIGNSYFGHQKLLKRGFASGSGLVGWEDPPKHLLDLVNKICERGNFLCMSVDILEAIDGQFYVNELQASFGSYNDSQMYINGVPGRYQLIDGEYIFEEGIFNTFGSNKLKIEHFIDILSDK